MTATQRAAMRQALEALEYMHQEKCDYMRRNNLGDPLREDAARLALPAITALRAALAEPEPVADEMKAQAFDALNRMQSIMMMNDGRHPRNVLRAFVQLASAPPTRQRSARAVIEQCRAALAEELSAWDIDPPLRHVKEAHDACVAWLAGGQVKVEERDEQP